MPSSDYQCGQSAAEAQSALLSALETLDQARHCAVLGFADIQKRKLFRELGYSSMRQYATVALGFSSSRCGAFLRLAAKLEELPALRDSLDEGRLGYTKAAEIIKVATPKTVERWVEVAQKSNRRDLAGKVKSLRIKAKQQRKGNPLQGSLLAPTPAEPEVETLEIPMRLNIEMTPLQFARYEALIERLYKQNRNRPDRAEALLVGLETVADEDEITKLENTPGISGGITDTPTTYCADSARRREIRPNPSAIRIHIHNCPTCAEKIVETNRGSQTLSEQSYQQAVCDAMISMTGRPNRATIPPRHRLEVMRRARHRCETPGCNHTRFLEVHHITPRVRGGANTPDNLRVCCSACHRLMHVRGNREFLPTGNA